MGYPNFLPGWETVDLLGAGGFSKVYKIKKIDDESTKGFYSALKVITVPATQDEYDQYVDDGCDEQSISAILREQVSSIVSEFELMASFKGTANIVSYEDHLILEKPGSKGYVVLIRMELLDTLTTYHKAHPLDEENVIKLGIDICHALMLCADQNIVHRDIKPQNIFVNKFGDFKLGDFGIARVMEHTTRATKIGTYSYISPEVYRGDPYNSTADIYSLGLVLYWLLNERRLPFMPLPPEVPTPSKTTQALEKRLKGQELPPPVGGCEALKRVVLKATAFDPSHRFSSAKEFCAALESVKYALNHSPVVLDDEKKDFRVDTTLDHLPEKTENIFLKNEQGSFEEENIAPQKTTPIEKLSQEKSVKPSKEKSKESYSTYQKPKKKHTAVWVVLVIIVFLVFASTIAVIVLNEMGIISIFKNEEDTLSGAISIGVSTTSSEPGAAEDYNWGLTDGTLMISGTGNMPDYEEGNSPWYGRHTEVKNVIISKGITSIGANAFAGCFSLKSIIVPNSVTVIGERAFYSCVSLSEIVLPESVEIVGEEAFYGCDALLNVTLNEGLVTIGERAFYSCLKLEEISIPKSVTSIKGNAFRNCSSLVSVDISDGITSVEEYTFYGCVSLKDVSIPSTVTSVGEWAFAGCTSLESVYLPKNVENVGAFAFCADTALREMRFPQTLTLIDEGALRGCTALSKIYYEGNASQWGDIEKGANWDYNTGFYDVTYVSLDDTTSEETTHDTAFEETTDDTTSEETTDDTTSEETTDDTPSE